jgi:hypothetical protein
VQLTKVPPTATQSNCSRIENLPQQRNRQEKHNQMLESDSNPPDPADEPDERKHEPDDSQDTYDISADHVSLLYFCTMGRYSQCDGVGVIVGTTLGVAVRVTVGAVVAVAVAPFGVHCHVMT